MQFPSTLTQREIPAFSKKLWQDAPAQGQWKIDLSPVTVIDSSFLALLLEILRITQPKGIQPVFTGLPTDARALMKMYGIYNLFEQNLL